MSNDFLHHIISHHHRAEQEINCPDYIPQYPNNPAKIELSQFDKLASESTLLDRMTAEFLVHKFNFLYTKFFESKEIISQEVHKSSPFEAREYQYALWYLYNSKQINIWGFDRQTGILADLQISTTQKVKVPARGTFIIELATNKGRLDSIILDIWSEPIGHNFDFCAVSFSVLHKLLQMLDDVVKTHNFYKNKVINQLGELLNISKCDTIDKVILPEKIISIIRSDLIDFFDYKIPLLEKYNLPTKRGFIFEGLPGTGKSFLIRALTNTVKASFIIVDSIPNTSMLQQYFELARRVAPTVLIFEDIDTYLFDRESGDRFLSPLLNELDGVQQNHKVITIITTNKLHVLDNALKNRPGRFDRVIKFGLPNKELTIAMLKSFSTKLDTSNIDFEKLVTSSNSSYSGAFWKNVVQTACIEKINRGTKDNVILTTQDLLDAVTELSKTFKSVKVSAGFQK